MISSHMPYFYLSLKEIKLLSHAPLVFDLFHLASDYESLIVDNGFLARLGIVD